MFVSKKRYKEILRELAATEARLDIRTGEVKRFQNALNDIVSQETANPNATVSRILSIAKKALEPSIYRDT